MKKATNPIRISIVTPSFNQGDYIEETICSVLDQKYPNLEYIIIDGGSTDNSVDVIRRYKKHLAYWVSEKDQGQTHAINKGFQRATGQVYAYLNSDDLYAAGTLSYFAEKYMSSRKPDAFFHAGTVEEFGETGTRGFVRPQAHNRLVDWIEYRAYLHQPGVFWSKEMHHAVGGFDEAYSYAFDRKFFMKAVSLGYRLSVDREQVVARFRRHPASKTESVGEKDHGFAPEFIRISEELRRHIGFVGRQRLRLSAFVATRERESSAIVYDNGDSPSLVALLFAGLIYPPQITSRFYLGALKNAIGLRRTDL